jgi:CRISPR/Cas system CSM-associated protein Csm3 (group 7 of RAMP superfamily)
MSFELAISITVVGPIMTPGIEEARSGRDDTFLRNADGKLIIPGTQIRGIARHVLRSIAEAAPKKLSETKIESWFGRGSANRDEAILSPANAWEPKRGKLRFSDFIWSDDSGPAAEVMTRIEVAADTGAVKSGSLQVIERPINIGQFANFAGTVMFDGTGDEASELARWLTVALKLVPSLGAHKSAGFGRVENIHITGPVQRGKTSCALTASQASTLAKNGVVAFSLKFTEPFLVSADRWLANSFRGSDAVSGSVLKAVLAEMTGASDPSHPLHDQLSQVVIREARLPCLSGKRPGQRPSTPPLSKYTITYPDGAHADTEDAFDADPETDLAQAGSIAFAPDWKSTPPELITDYGTRTDISQQVRTRTAIDEFGIADENKLFSHAALQPKEGQTWRGLIAQGRLGTAEFEALLAVLPAQLENIGKTRVAADLTVETVNQLPLPPATGKIRFVLETDAVLHTPTDVFAHDDAPDLAERLKRQYAHYFAAALNERGPPGGPLLVWNDMEVKFFARQKRVGGYIALRYPPSDGGYCPWFVTCSGSAFEINVPASHADAFKSFLERGLPPPTGFGTNRQSWHGNPFVPENGFGEIRLLKVNGKTVELS